MKLNQNGFTTMSVLMLGVIGVILTFFMLTIVTTTLRNSSHGALKSERTLNAALLYPHIDCTNTYRSMITDATHPVPDITTIVASDYATYCASEPRYLQSTYLLRLKDQNNGDLGVYNSADRLAKLGNFSYRASCAISSAQRCLTVHEAIPVGTGYRKNAQLNQDYSWTPTFVNQSSNTPFGVCCLP